MIRIAGFITRQPRQHALLELTQMINALRYECSSEFGVWLDERLGVYVGWVIRGSSRREIPLRNQREDVIVVFSGEEFSEPTTVSRLKDKGHDVGQKPWSYLVHLYEDDTSFPAGLNGRFHGLVVDQGRETALLFNDRFGMNRLYYHEFRDRFYFASEAKAILAVRPELKQIDPRGLGEFISCGAVLENRTLFEDIYILPPASGWIFRDGALMRKASYFDPLEWEGQEALDLESYYHDLREVFTRNLPRYFSGDQKVGMSLTGGLDTRMILACRKPDPGSLPCYTFGSMFRENHDVRVARRVAQACGQTHQVITAGDDFLSQFPRYAERAVFLTDGCVDVSRAPDLYLNERAREIAPVRMTGNYGGEILRGVRAFKPVEPAAGLFAPHFLYYIRQAAQTYEEIARCHPVSFAAFKLAPWYLYGVLALEQTQLSMRSPFLDNDFVQTVFRAPASTRSSNEISLRLITDGNPALLSIPTDRGLAGQMGPMRAALSRAFLEFQFKAEYAYDMGMPQWLARLDHAFSPFHPQRLFLGRHKPFHFRVWYRDQLARYVQGILLDPRSLSRPHIDPKGAEGIVRNHTKGKQNYTTELHRLLTLELIYRTLLDNAENMVLGQSRASLPCVDFVVSMGQNSVSERQPKCGPA